MSNVANIRKTKELQGDTFKIAHDAKTAKKENDRVIDATVGALFDNEGQFHMFQTIAETIKKIEDQRQFAYPPIDGGNAFRKSLIHWVFQEHEQDIRKIFYLDSIATPGACGALHNAFLNYMEQEDTLIMPDIYWTNYRAILSNINRTYRTYPMFEEDHFNVEGLKKTISKALETSKRIILLFNDPAHNPTGYSLKKSEWKEIYSHVNELIDTGKHVTIVYDLAYMDYSGESFRESREIFESIKDVHERLLMLFAFSGSKSFSLYGQRLGGLIAVSKNASEIDSFGKVARFVARSTWSCPPATGVRLIEDLASVEKRFIAELEEARDVLKVRSKTFIEESLAIGLKHYPYESGFFMTLIVEDPIKAYDTLSKQGIFGIPVERGLRLALSSLSLADVKGLAQRIKHIL